MSLKIGVLASGNGTNAKAIMDKIAEGKLDAEVTAVICNTPGASVLQRAKRAGAPTFLLDHRKFPDRGEHEKAMLEVLDRQACHAVALAGYMRLLGPDFLAAYKDRVLNIHPAILPSFPGMHAARDALDYGMKISGVSVHFVEEKMDAGPLIIQAAVPVKAEDTEESLLGRIHVLEHRIYPQALQWLAEDRLELRGRHVSLLPGGKKLAPPERDMLVWPPLEQGF